MPSTDTPDQQRAIGLQRDTDPVITNFVFTLTDTDPGALFELFNVPAMRTCFSVESASDGSISSEERTLNQLPGSARLSSNQ
jgi:hypothetical protein